MALVNSFIMPKTMLQMPMNSKPCSLHNKIVIIRCAAARRKITEGPPSQINQVLSVTSRSLGTEQVSLRSSSLTGEDGKTKEGNAIVDEVNNTTKTADDATV
ncbi:unnamed protein product [Prunus armeniaca]|uniref:Uncharacterized protein n=1 Tax=Prunus armeniaca TaxID=36596 RepID=A0A6J5ULC4_PRUAR|nr:unnamed protein product [Prunus armeniaca]